MAPTTLAGLVLLTVLYGLADGTKVRNCRGRSYGKRIEVDIKNCPTPPCLMKKNSTTVVAMNFIPDRDIKQLKTRVHAVLGGLPLPFPGVDGTSACKYIFLKDTSEAGCPLKADNEYVYKFQFDVLPIYPTVNPLVRWALQDPATNGNAVCFEVLTKIVQ